MTFYDPVNDVARGERAVVVVPERVGEGSRRSTEARLDEAEGLAGAIGVDVVARKAFRLRQARPATLLGKGQVDPITKQTVNMGGLDDQQIADIVAYLQALK